MAQEKSVGILLAGGKSKRYGSPKAFAEKDGKYFYEISYQILAEICEHVIIVTREEFIERFPSNYDCITDVPSYRGCGPLAGIYSAMQHKRTEQYVVLPCDMPLLTYEVIANLLTFHTKDVTLVVSEGYKQPLVSIWNKRTKQTIEEALRNNEFKMTSVLDRLQVTYVDGRKLTDSPYVFMNVNTLEEDKEMRQWSK